VNWLTLYRTTQCYSSVPFNDVIATLEGFADVPEQQFRKVGEMMDLLEVGRACR
jgi:hypothetical protein